MRAVPAALAAIIATNYNMDIAGVEDFVAGLIFGLIAKDDLPEIQKCLANGELLEQEITNAISDISKGDLSDIIKAVEEIGHIITELPQDLADCQGMSDDIAKIENWAKIFSHPTTLVATLTKNLLANWSAVFADVSKTEADWTAEDFYNAGDDIADILVLSLGKPTQTEQMESIDWDFLKMNLNPLF